MWYSRSKQIFPHILSIIFHYILLSTFTVKKTAVSLSPFAGSLQFLSSTICRWLVFPGCSEFFSLCLQYHFDVFAVDWLLFIPLRAQFILWIWGPHSFLISGSFFGLLSSSSDSSSLLQYIYITIHNYMLYNNMCKHLLNNIISLPDLF